MVRMAEIVSFKTNDAHGLGFAADWPGNKNRTTTSHNLTAPRNQTVRVARPSQP